MVYLLFVVTYLFFPAFWYGLPLQMALLMFLYWGPLLRGSIPKPIEDSRVTLALGVTALGCPVGAFLFYLLRSQVDRNLYSLVRAGFLTIERLSELSHALMEAPLEDPVALAITLLLLLAVFLALLLYCKWLPARLLPIPAGEKRRMTVLLAAAITPYLALAPYQLFIHFYSPL